MSEEEKGERVPKGVIVQTTTTVVTTEDAEPLVVPEWYVSLYDENEEERMATMRAIQACENGEFDPEEEDKAVALHTEYRSSSAPP